ncbi:LacI family DNA-binding transcriptional regulator [Sphingomonas sp. KR1UV-12]|uniref:LacI family DNA-binding transcriptional regulator n=1 Tax=Sphingomonas aurea TaxID=3063994 RepID=A0ABT9EL29_9SPHN|nr:LacI family DNA-binding transcriptional regulator [Sphingomonas sp. KR1UV-12]MDP1027670.1 LacI family DNA-binding transcriptional regulator [Sphingomonas sp. KR1UV-12]
MRSGQPTINDVARLAGVSKKTVSRVINRSPLLGPDTRAQVEAVIGQLGYVPNPQARALALRRNFLVGLVHDNANAQTVMSVQRGMLEGLRGTEFEMVVRPLDRDAATMSADLRHFLERQRLHGVLLLPPISEDDAVAALCAELGCRYVRMGSAPLDDAARSVASDDRAAVRSAVAFLIEQGHRRIGLIAGPPGFRSGTERRLGFEDALADAGLAVAEELVAPGRYTFASGLEAAERLLDRVPRPTAIFACNDEMAAGVIHAAHDRGLAVPRDLSVVGFDDTPTAAQAWPPLTTVRWPVVDMARAAARKLIATPDAPDEPALFPSALVQRRSVSIPAA